MKLFKLAIALFAFSIFHSHAEEPDLGKLVAETTQAAAQKKITPEDFKAALAKIVDALAPKLGVEKEPERKAPQNLIDKLEFAVSRPGADDERAAYCSVLAAKLGSELSAPAKIWMLKSLERIGKTESVAVEVKLLADADETVRETARRALACNTSPESSAELRKAIAAAGDVKARAALIEALGYKRDKADAAIFETEAKCPDAGVKTAALAALAIQGSPRDPAPMSEAARLIEMARAGNAGDIPKLVAALDSDNIKVRQAAVQAVNLNPSPEMTKALLEKLKAASAELKPALILVLAQRGDKSALPAIREELANADAAVRAAAARGLGTIGDGTCVTPLMTMAVSGKGEEQRAARDSLERMKGKDVDTALVAFLPNEKEENAKEAVQRLVARNAVSTVPDLTMMVVHSTGAMHAEGLKALGALAGKETLPWLVTMLVKTEAAAERDEVAKAAVAIARRLPSGDDRAEPFAAALKEAGEPARLAILSALGQLGGNKALEAVKSALKDANPKIQDAAIRALAAWPDAAALNELLELAKSLQNDTHRVLALRGYFRLAGLPSTRAPKDSTALFVSGLEAAKKPDEKKPALSGLADVKDFSALEACAKAIADKDVTEEACAAVVKSAKQFENSNKTAVAAMLHDVVAHTKNQNTKNQANEILGRIEKK